MDLDPPPSAPKKQVRFAPKPPPRRKPKPIPAKIEPAVDDDEEAAQRQILLIERLSMRKPKAEGKSSGQDASRTIRTYGKQMEKIDDKSDAAKSKETLDDVQKLVTYNGVTVKKKKKKKKKEFKEPWDYNHSYYPTTLPLRRPYSGDPELLDKAEFEDAPEYDENSVDSALDLGLLDKGDDDTPRMLSFQFPSNLSLDSSRASRASKGKEIAGSSGSRESGYHPSRKGCNLEDLPEGYMGKMLVYKSGAVKLKLGDLLYDVSPGSDCCFAQSVVAIDTVNRQCCELGEVNKRAIVTPDIDSLMDNVIDLG